ncbi:hypothetical protein CMUS01_12411 [Colletotrichum musicola]|uniref:Uncharacterized protein n=1 Tax=Colletotrichum musicola TaxID=2175873 RepID=A0A8H6JML8_9PEZI|nr:hypothetical protein CMUS01_12411 [Colletotrichum musicola]
MGAATSFFRVCLREEVVGGTPPIVALNHGVFHQVCPSPREAIGITTASTHTPSHIKLSVTLPLYFGAPSGQDFVPGHSRAFEMSLIMGADLATGNRQLFRKTQGFPKGMDVMSRWKTISESVYPGGYLRSTVVARLSLASSLKTFFTS